MCNSLLNHNINLLVLGNGSLFCTNCSYNCSACHKKIDGMAVLTGEQAFCSSCFRCRNCKKKIEDLQYARTSQGTFCMNCHQTLLARKKKAAALKASAAATAAANSSSISTAPLPATSSATAATTMAPLQTPGFATPMLTTEATTNNSTSTTAASSTTSSPTSITHTIPHKATQIISTASPPTTIIHSASLSFPQAQGAGFPSSSSPSLAQYSVQPKRSSISFKEKSLPQLPTEEHSSDSPPSNNAPSLSPSTSSGSGKHYTLQRSNSAHSSSFSTSHPTYNLPNMPASAMPPQLPQFGQMVPTVSPPIRPSHQPAFDPALVRMPLRSQPMSSASRSASSSSDQAASSINHSDSINGFAPIVSASHSSPSAAPSSFFANINNGSSSSATATLTETREEITLGSKFTPHHKKDGSGSPSNSFDLSSQYQQSLPVDNSPRRLALAPEFFINAPIDLQTKTGSSSRGGVYIVDSSSLNSPTSVDEPDLKSYKNEAVKLDTESSNESTFSSTSSNENLEKFMMERTVLRSIPSNYTNIPRAPVIPAGTAAASTSAAASATGATADSKSKIPQLPPLGTDLTVDDELNPYLMRSNRLDPRRTSSGHFRSASENRLSTPKYAAVSSPTEPTPSPSLLPITRELADARKRIADLELQLRNRATHTNTANNLETNINEKRKTVAGLEAKGEVVKLELSALEEAISHKDSLKDTYPELIKKFVNEVSQVKESLRAEIEELMLTRNKLVEETTELIKTREVLIEENTAIVVKNNQLHDLHLQLARAAVEKFGPISAQFHPEDSSHAHNHHNATAAAAAAAAAGSHHGHHHHHHHGNNNQTAILDASTDDKKPGRRFWKRPTAAVAKGVKGFNKVFNQDQSQNQQLISTGPYTDNSPLATENMFGVTMNSSSSNGAATSINSTMNSDDGQAPAPNNNSLSTNGTSTSTSSEKSKPRNAWFKSGSQQSATESQATSSSTGGSLMGTGIEKRIEFENTNIPLIVTRCIQEVEERGMAFEGIYRKSGGRSQIATIEEAFEKMGSDGEASEFDEVLSGDISGVTSALKQYLRYLPNPLIPFEAYEDFVEASREANRNPELATEMLRTVINNLPQAYKECLSFVINHLVNVTKHADVNLMTPRNLAVVFAPTLVRHTNGEREILDMQPRNDGTQFMIEKYAAVFSDVFIHTEPPPPPVEAQAATQQAPPPPPARPAQANGNAREATPATPNSSSASSTLSASSTVSSGPSLTTAPTATAATPATAPVRTIPLSNSLKIITDINTDKLDIDSSLEAALSNGTAVGRSSSSNSNSSGGAANGYAPYAGKDSDSLSTASTVNSSNTVNGDASTGSGTKHNGGAACGVSLSVGPSSHSGSGSGSKSGGVDLNSTPVLPAVHYGSLIVGTNVL